MATFEVFSPPINKLYINDVEQDISGKKVVITKNPGKSWNTSTLNYQYSGTGIGKVFIVKKDTKVGQELSDDLLCIVDGSRIKKLDMSTMTWSTFLDLPYTGQYIGACIYDGHIHIFGGKEVSGSGWTKAIRKFHYIYHLGTDEQTSQDVWKWDKLNNIPYEFYNGGVEVADGLIHLVGGGPSDTTKTKHAVWDGTAWKAKKTLPKKLDGFSKTYTANGRLYIICNSLRKNNNYNMIVSSYVIESNEWFSYSGRFMYGSNPIDGPWDQKKYPTYPYVYTYGYYKENANDSGVLLVNFKTINGYSNTVCSTTAEPGAINAVTEDSPIPIISGEVQNTKSMNVQVIMFKGYWIIFIDEPVNNVSKSALSYSLSIT